MHYLPFTRRKSWLFGHHVAHARKQDGSSDIDVCSSDISVWNPPLCTPDQHRSSFSSIFVVQSLIVGFGNTANNRTTLCDIFSHTQAVVVAAIRVFLRLWASSFFILLNQLTSPFLSLVFQFRIETKTSVEIYCINKLEWQILQNERERLERKKMKMWDMKPKIILFMTI